MPRWKFYVATFGCKVNQYESQLLREAWQAAGGEETLAPSDADCILINSCAITARAERNGRNAVFKLRQLAPGARIILTGCAAQFYASFKPRQGANWIMPDLCVTQADKKSLLAGPYEESGQNAIETAINSYSRARPVIKIQDGCAHKCSYCIVPQTRSKPFSRPRTEILRECRNFAQSGCGELVLSGINLRHYNDGGDFWDLLSWLDRQLAPEFKGTVRLRISSLDPSMLDHRALEILAACDLTCPHLHISLQHASPVVLGAMRRGHCKPGKILETCINIGGLWPFYGLGADILVGFPGETEDDIKLLSEFICALPLTYAHVFPYSRRQGTEAANMAGQIAKSEKERRAWQIRELVAAKQLEFWQSLLVRETMLIAADSPEGSTQGRGVNEFYAPCVFDWPVEIKNPRRLLAARPVGICDEGLRVEIESDCVADPVMYTP